jgi:hypothetical protein
MILGMSLPAFTLFHVALSLIAIAAGFVVLFSMFGAKVPRGWTALFLIMTALTSVTGYFFPAEKVLPSHIVGVITLVVVALASLAVYRYRLMRSWRWIYVVSAISALYLNVFVGVVQSFLKVPFLKALAPTQAEPPFAIAQAVVLLTFVAAAIVALRLFHPGGSAATLRPLTPQRG